MEVLVLFAPSAVLCGIIVMALWEDRAQNRRRSWTGLPMRREWGEARDSIRKGRPASPHLRTVDRRGPGRGHGSPGQAPPSDSDRADAVRGPPGPAHGLGS